MQDFGCPLAPSWAQNGPGDWPSGDQNHVIQFLRHTPEPACSVAFQDAPGHRFDRFWMILGWMLMDFGFIFDGF